MRRRITPVFLVIVLLVQSAFALAGACNSHDTASGEFTSAAELSLSSAEIEEQPCHDQASVSLDQQSSSCSECSNGANCSRCSAAVVALSLRLDSALPHGQIFSQISLYTHIPPRAPSGVYRPPRQP